MDKDKGNDNGAILVGEDRELGNFLTGYADRPGVMTGGIASQMLLSRVGGTPSGGGYQTSSMDWGRKWLSNGSCVYIDSEHLETATAECADAFQLVAASRAMLKIARAAMDRANAELRALDEEYEIEVLVNNSDRKGHAWGSHLSFLIPRAWYDDLFDRRPQNLAYLASIQASSILYDGAGKVGAENGAPDDPYQVSERADHFEVIRSPHTMFRRPLVNSRDEPLCGRSTGLARLHAIGKDSTLCQTATLLKTGVMQLNLAMMGMGEATAMQKLQLDNPVAAVRNWSHDPELKLRQRLVNGKNVTAAEHQLLNAEAMASFLDGCARAASVVPRAGEIMEIYIDTLEKLKARDFAALVPRLDWVLKKKLIERAIERNPGLDWSSRDRLKALDLRYSHLNPGKGLFWPVEESGAVEKVVTDEEISRLVGNPPEETRAWTRGKLLALATPEEVHRVDWDSLEFMVESRSGDRIWKSLHVDLDDPREFGMEACAELDRCRTLEEAARILVRRRDRESAIATRGTAAPPPPPRTKPVYRIGAESPDGIALDAATGGVGNRENGKNGKNEEEYERD